ncbi:MAG: hypothetical protein K8S27_01100 [Candidatus Omnitrophica bacterium]|nr:hypothetical protein [Candidatus Omnitrophota bacterium]
MANTKNEFQLKFFIVYLICLFLILEGTARLYLCFRYKINPLNPGRTISSFYPELFPAADHQIVPDDAFFDVLLLGASVVNYRISDIDRRLVEGLTEQLGRKVRIFNLSKFAHSSRDSLMKYQFLRDKSFDLVLIYHGINEVRSNNIPAHLFKSDYSHCPFYERVNTFNRHQEISFVVFPWLVHDLIINMKQRFSPDNYIPFEQPRAGWLRYGKELKATESFKQNFEDIINIAAAKNEPIVLSTFAYYLPEQYSRQNFEGGLLDYTPGEQAVPAEIWGHPQNVVSGLDAHNTVIENLRDMPGQIIFVDQRKLIPASGDYFIDICHFSPKGNQQFINNIISPVVDFFRP